MSVSLPAASPRARSLTGVLPEMLASLDAASGWLPPVRSAILLVIDGLGARMIAERAGHARFLAAAGGKRDVATTVFPSTTASALTSLFTGVEPGEHGIVGYRVRVAPGDVRNQLTGWREPDMAPGLWQRTEPLLAARARAGRPGFVVSKPEFAGSGFSLATTRGAEFHGVLDLRERVRRARALADGNDGALVYLYVSELDSAGHRHGVDSGEWLAALEETDAAVRELTRALPPDVGLLVTADHGMIDVPRHRQILLGEGDPLLDGVAEVGGEPRMLHLYAEDGRADAVLDRWRETESSRSWVLSREEAIAAGLFGPRVDPAVRDRIGDVLVAARASVVYYDDRVADKTPQRMVGQHGSLTDAERIVPLHRLGAYAAG
ncbi:nucleotide pyrophosphatase/phosphodiesterase family protein [Microbacterium sp. X-17]|uniref:alkaline phosphatase family protein n=1 Tax=Microbacterium sp. X-17 TaxID=3144404 RepID=UPI0031F4BEB5